LAGSDSGAIARAGRVAGRCEPAAQEAARQTSPRVLSRDEDIVVVGPTPPPIHGVAFVTPLVVDAVARAGRLAGHLDTSDPRPVLTTGRFDLRNAWLGVKHAFQLTALLLRRRGAAVYLPLSQTTLGFLRDAAFIWTAVLLRRRVIIHLHGGGFRRFAQDAGPLMRAIIATTARRIDEAWVLTAAHERMFDGLLPRDRVRILENAAEDIGAQLEAKPGNVSRPARRFLYLSNLLPEKGCFDVLDALDLLGERVRGCEFRFAGEADDRVLVEFARRAARLERLGVSVRYEGVVVGDAKVELFGWADAFVFPSRYRLEGQPLCVLEAMSAGLPVISTDHSGIPHTVRDESEGLIVAPGSPGQTAEAIMRLAADPELRGQLADGARARYIERYQPARFRAAVANLLLEPRTKSPPAR
jgi:glycosyltransferase involved in cell wall biosynthesis